MAKHLSTVVEQLALLGRNALSSLSALGQAAILLLLSIFIRPQNWRQAFYLWVKQVYFVGVLSLVVVVVSGAFIGMVLALQGYTVLVKFASEEAVGQLVALTLLRELGPVVTALLFAGRAGSALTAEIALMNATEQLASMEMMGVDPIRRIIATRLWAGFFTMPLLSFIFCVVGLVAGAFVTTEWLGVYQGAYWGNINKNVDFFYDLLNGGFKALVFGFLVTWIAVYQGFFALPTAEGISRATTKTVVYSSLVVLAFDFLLTALMFGDF